MADLTDDDLMQLFAEGDADAFDVLFDRHGRRAYHLARSLVRRDDVAEEILQESFLAVARQGGKYRPRGRFRGWLLRIVRNRCLNWLAADRARREALERSRLQPSHRPTSTPHEAMVCDELSDWLMREIEQLPLKYREVLVLHAYERLSYRELAEVLDLPINTVKTYLHRARGRLARRLETSREVFREV